MVTTYACIGDYSCGHCYSRFIGSLCVQYYLYIIERLIIIISL